MTETFDSDLDEATIGQLQGWMSAGELTSEMLVEAYERRVRVLDHGRLGLQSVLELNPAARSIARALDGERRANRVRGPLHGIPILIKDNIGTADDMQTTAGSLALVGAKPTRDATVIQRLRKAGAVILGKTNMSEWANFRSFHSSSGWSGRGGQCLNPYALDRSPGGSSSGSAVAVAANLCVASIGTETDGSIVLPAALNGVVGIKPTVGLTSRIGVIPVAPTQDSVGPIARTVTDAAIVLDAIAGNDSDAALVNWARSGPHGYVNRLEEYGLVGARIGIPRRVFWGYSEKADSVMEVAIRQLRDLGAVVIDPANIPTARRLTYLGSERTIFLYEFKSAINAYLAGLPKTLPVASLADAIRFNEAHAKEELAYFGQELFYLAQAKGDLRSPEYRRALNVSRRQSRAQGIDAVMDRLNLDALVMPTSGPAWKIDHLNGDHIQGLASTPAAQAGYPLVTVPAGFTSGLPIGLTFSGRRFSEARLLQFAFAFERATNVRKAPKLRARARPDDL